jgi:hypothetical protein
MKRQSISPRSFCVDIQPVNRDVYDDVIAEFVKQFARLKGVLCIAHFGSIKSPGISDIDLLVVIENEHYQDIERRAKEFRRQSHIHRYLFWHAIEVIPLSALPQLRYVSTVENLRILWGPPAIFDCCRKPDEFIQLLQTILWKGHVWGRLLCFCGKEQVSLRWTLLRLKSARLEAANSYRFAGQHGFAEEALSEDREFRERVLSALPVEQTILAKDAIGIAIESLLRSDRYLGDWLAENGISCIPVKTRKKTTPNWDHLVLFDGAHSVDDLHQHSGDMHYTHLSSFYYTMTSLVARPFLVLNPRLAKVWDETVITSIPDRTLQSASQEWNDAFTTWFTQLRQVGGRPTTMTVYPLNVDTHFSIATRFKARAARIRRDLGGVRTFLRHSAALR